MPILPEILKLSAFPDSLLGVHVQREENGKITQLIASNKDQQQLGYLRCLETTITEMQVDETMESHAGIIASALIKSICHYADARKVHLTCLPMNEDGNLSIKRLMERFGFREIEDGLMERIPGSVLSFDALTTDSLRGRSSR